jgi:hypothetical protein
MVLTPAQPPLQINSLAYSHTVQRLVVGGPDGYCAVLPTGPEAKVSEESVVLKGHVGDVLNVKFFPSGQVSLLNIPPAPAYAEMDVRSFSPRHRTCHSECSDWTGSIPARSRAILAG